MPKIRNTLNQKLVINLNSGNIDLLAKDKIYVKDEDLESPHLKTLLAREIIEVEPGDEKPKPGKEKTGTEVKPSTLEELKKLPISEIKEKFEDDKIYTAKVLQEYAKTLKIYINIKDREKSSQKIIEAIEAAKTEGAEE